MDVFISKIALKEEITKKEIYSVIKTWLENGPNYKMILAYNENDETYFAQGITKNGSLKLAIVSTYLNSSDIFGCHFENIEENNCWVTDCIHVKNDKNNIFTVKLSCKTKSYSKFPKVHKPYLIKLLMEKGYCQDNDLFPITDKPIRLKKDQLKYCADIMLGKIETTLPVVYVSMDICREELYAVDVDKLAQLLSGLAHVIVEPDYDFSRLLTNISKKRNPINGYIAIYFPNTSYKKTVPVYEDGHRINEKELKEKIYSILVETSLNCAKTADLNWESLQVQLTKFKYENQKSETNKTTKELDDFLYACDEEIDGLKKQIDDLNLKIENKEQENFKLQSKIDGIKTQLENSKTKCNSPTLNFIKGDLKELTADEIKETIINALIQCLDKLDKNGRPFNILTEFLDKNKLTGCCKNFYADICSALKEKSFESRRKQLEKLGFVIDKDDHDKIKIDGIDELFTLAGSGSDYRGPENAYHDILKKIDVYAKFN